MSCIFCYSNLHFSQNCNIFVSDESRQKYLLSKNRCNICLSEVEFREEDLFPSHGCIIKVKCYICLSKTHHTVYCPSRDIVPNGCIPKIDQVLFHRFLQFLNPLEQFSLAFYTVYPSNITEFNELKVADSFKFYYINSLKSNSVIIGKATLSNVNTIFKGFSKVQYKYTCDSRMLHTITFMAKDVILKNSRLSSNDFFHFLSISTKSLVCTDIIITPRIRFDDILYRIPCVKNIELSKTNIKMGTQWPEQLLNLKNIGNLKKIKLHIDSVEFNVGTLAAIFRTNKKIVIQLHVRLSYWRQTTLFYYKRKFEKYFVFIEQPVIFSSQIIFSTTKEEESHFYSLKLLEKCGDLFVGVPQLPFV